MRKKMVAGNWKMNNSRSEAKALLQAIKTGAQELKGVDIVVFPSFVHLQLTEDILANTLVGWGGQNLHTEQSGAFTGEISGSMLTNYGCQYVLVGHSERRQLFNENLKIVAEKFKAASQVGLQPILCVGETLEQRENGQTDAIIAEQLSSVIHAVGMDLFQKAIIAYEPVWAIGTGLTATPEQAQATHAFIRNHLKQYHVEVAATVRILYGGSVKADNAEGLFAMPDIDGGLVGGASLSASQFLGICSKA